ncbi:ribosomal-protein-alanine N-acetyltransferase [Altererythrobacter xiamenensis]|uniref:Ribosomal-protein-alanine N-acetyltransferase n=1 Tax=Altererythrobacter xiamenensis TaxID=1316679 RepID=A0A1Y6EE05_9SPHN|nr:GNAT family N-acetyltransferase [Altererythrobacter xiamenensis]SMQ59160.1 ribosomal-protein-alanine N-acetyltransferase [Altererythrobacter xiamenensis]
MSHADLIDQIMMVMEQAFDPIWGEAWNRNQVAGALAMPTTYAILVDAGGRHTGPMGPPAAGFVLSRNAPGEEELLLIAVSPDHRRKGLGKILIEELAKAARSRGAERIFLEMRSNNPAESLYRLAGFEPIGKRKNYYLKSDGERLDAITFGLTI